jgi:hypothetical protein
MFEADLAVSVVSFSFINNSLCFGMFNVYMDSDYPFGIFKLFFICMLYVRSYPVRCEMYSIQHNVIQFIRDLRQVGGGFLRVLRFPPPKQMTATIQLKYC